MKKKREQQNWYAPTQEAMCPLCRRPIPPANLDKHHLIPKTEGGRETQAMHRICHRQIHALFSESELAQRYNTVDALLEHEAMRKFVAWVKTKPDGFHQKSKLSNRRK